MSRTDPKRVIIYTLVMLAVIVWGALLMLPGYWMLWITVTAVLVYSLLVWYTRHFAYRCAKCGEEFAVSVIGNLTGLQGLDRNGSWKALKCPGCGGRTRARVIKRTDYPWSKKGLRS